MQANTITLPVDILNDGNTTNEVYERFEEHLNRSVYIGENHVPEDRDQLMLYRTFPTKSGNFKGVMKTSFKLSKDFAVDGVDSTTSVTAPLIIEVNVSCPVGVSQADMLHARQRALALLDLDSVMTPLNSQGMV